MEKIKAYAKINLTLDVLRKRTDHYHDLCSIMHSIDLYDTVTVEKHTGISIECSCPLPDDSATYRAARAYMALTGCGARIHIERCIPDEAGMGAASANAAAVLTGMDKLYGALSAERLFKLAGMIGADVPFCLMQGCALAEGIGEILTPLPHIALDLLIVKGERGVSTKALFGSLALPVPHPNTVAAIRAVKSGDCHALTKHMFNSLEQSAMAMAPDISKFKSRLLECGALGAVMTGSGSAVVGVFPNSSAALAAQSRFEECSFTAVCRTI
ncbi:MAG: 4-(cytidine 5'-diphospho)-2-C-methyl-D-erythritol kinase [Clostridia bacterium]